jgi:ABC-type multidrug transport system ATPase subunit
MAWTAARTTPRSDSVVRAATLRLAGITKHWPGAPSPILDGLDLAVESGTTLRIDGPNGSGKTTLLRIAAGLIRPECGRVQVGPWDVEADRTLFQRHIGFLSAAAAGLYARLTVHDHLRLWSRLALMARSEAADGRRRVTTALGLEELLDRRVDRLSMGQRQRVRLAAAFLHDPDVVLLDEPANSLDDDGVHLLATEIDRLRSRGGSALFCVPAGARDTVPSDEHLTITAGRLVAT